MPRAARLNQLISYICVAEQTENLVDEGTKNTHYKLALVHDDRPNTRDDWGWFSNAALSNICCQEMGIVRVPSWISMRQKGGDVVDAAWQNSPLRGEESIGSEAIRGCHVREGVWYHTIRCGGTAFCQMLSAVSVPCELGVHTSREKSVVSSADFVHMLGNGLFFVWT